VKTIRRTETYHAAPEKIFRYLDNLGVTGMHMTKSSAMMMGSKLHLEYLTAHHTGPATQYRWTGIIMGMQMDFTVEVTKWVEGVEKVWETIGEAKMIIYSWYRMNLFLTKNMNETVAALSITYEKPKGWFPRILSFLFADWYGNWCLKNMLTDAKKSIESTNQSKIKYMKLLPFKLGIALGIAFSIGFLVCNIVFLIGGHGFSLSVMNQIFHETDFKPLMTNEGFSLGKLLCGMGILFLAGTFIGWVTAFIYNLGKKQG
jgi:hypothetical protein